MIQAFRKSRIGFYGVLAIAAAIAAAVWIRDQDYPLFVPIIASSLTLAIGYVAARLLGNLLAASENTRHLGYLHMELDPDKFIAGYRDIPGRMKGENNRAISRSYLADGYAAAGDYETAISLLESPPADNLAVQGLYAANRAGLPGTPGHRKSSRFSDPAGRDHRCLPAEEIRFGPKPYPDAAAAPASSGLPYRKAGGY